MGGHIFTPDSMTKTEKAKHTTAPKFADMYAARYFDQLQSRANELSATADMRVSQTDDSRWVL